MHGGRQGKMALAAGLAVLTGIGIGALAAASSNETLVFATEAEEPSVAVTATFVEPTTPPLASSTATPVPTATAIATPTPTAVPTPTATPLPTPIAKTGDEELLEVRPGLVRVRVNGIIAFVMSETHGLLQREGHVAIHPEGSSVEVPEGEVNIFRPVLKADGSALRGFNAVVGHIVGDDQFSDLISMGVRTVDGYTAHVYLGQLARSETGKPLFYTDVDQSAAGWFAPDLVEMWVIDGPRGVVVVTAEGYEGFRDNFGQARALALEILDSLVL